MLVLCEYKSDYGSGHKMIEVDRPDQIRTKFAEAIKRDCDIWDHRTSQSVLRPCFTRPTNAVLVSYYPECKREIW